MDQHTLAPAADIAKRARPNVRTSCANRIYAPSYSLQSSCQIDQEATDHYRGCSDEPRYRDSARFGPDDEYETDHGQDCPDRSHQSAAFFIRID
jgi:hypothetical protein